MSLNTGFENTASKERENAPHKKTVSRGLIITASILAVVIVAWILLGLMNKSLMKEIDTLQSNIVKVNESIRLAMNEEDSDFASRAYIVEKDLYREYEANDILGEIEKIMIIKNSDQSGSRVVLKSFQYNAGSNTEKNFKDGNATITGNGSVTITADADTFDVMAQQIEVFKKSNYFNNVKVGATDRDDSGRIIFTLTMDVADYNKSPYENDMQIENDVKIEMPIEEGGTAEAPIEEVNNADEENIELNNTENVTNTANVATNTVTDEEVQK